MLVYGDASWEEEPAQLLAQLREGLAEVRAAAPGLPRHAALVGLLLDAGVLAQGLLDADFHRRGHDTWDARTEALLRLPLALARAVRRSWESGFTRLGEVQPPSGLEAPAPDGPLRLKVPEGYAFYALYPELYLEAARGALEAGGPLQVIGLRSIGTSLACAVAVGARGEEAPVPVTVRPVGPPFARALALAPPLRAHLLAPGARAAHYAVVDEGPGLSGSSFGCVADLLEAAGVPAHHVHFFPSHAGAPGPAASEAHRRRWRSAARHVEDFDARLAPRLARWAEPLCGPATGPLEDVGGGAWRARHFAGEDEWPAANVQLERRKYLLPTQEGPWLLKFAGLGRWGAAPLARARTLQAAGFIPPVAGLCHGFLVGRWLEGARPLCRVPDFPRAALHARVGAYLAHRARHLGAGAKARGAGPRELLQMARRNTRLALGVEAARVLERFTPELPRLEREARPVQTDNRLHAWEWLVLADGRLLKADALEHCAAHDLVGCQDVAWDVAGAAVELGLEEEALGERPGLGASRTARRFYRACYLAFQLGQATLGAEALAQGCPAEAARLRGAAARTAARLQQVLADG